MRTLVVGLLAIICSWTVVSAHAGSPISFGVIRPQPVCFQPVRPINCWGGGWNRWNSGWGGGFWGPPMVIVSYGNPDPVVSSGFGTLRVPETRIIRVPAPISLTNGVTVQEGASFRWRR